MEFLIGLLVIAGILGFTAVAGFVGCLIWFFLGLGFISFLLH